MEKSKVLRLINKYERENTGPKQGSKEWLDQRIPCKKVNRKRGRIGGSDTGTLLGKNPFKTRTELMTVKLGKRQSKPINSFFCWYGILMEEVAVKCFEKVYSTKVMCKEISVIDSNLTNFIFSPDGVCPMPVDEEDLIIIDLDEKEKAKRFVPTLIEIKCPLNRRLTNNKNVPDSYMAQVQAGLICLDLVHGAVFIDNSIKVSAFTELPMPGKYNKELHRSHKTPLGNKEELECGIILVYANPDKDGNLPNLCPPRSVKDQKFRWRGKYIVDYTKGSLDVFTNLLSNSRTNIMAVDYLPPLVQDDLVDLGREEPGDALERILHRHGYSSGDTFSEERLQGIISWKQFDASYTLVYKDKGYEKEIVDAMDNYNEGKIDYDVELGAMDICF